MRRAPSRLAHKEIGANAVKRANKLKAVRRVK